MADQDTGITVDFTKRDDGKIEVIFTNGSGKPFQMILQRMTWGVFRSLTAIQKMNPKDTTRLDKMLEFFDTYVEGGADAVDLDKTAVVFTAIARYAQHVFSRAAEKN